MRKKRKKTSEHFSVAADGIMQAHIPIIAKFLTKKSPSVFGNIKKKNGFDNSLYFPALQRVTGVVINL